MEFTAITQELLTETQIQSSEFLSELCKATIAMYSNNSATLPWLGYLAQDNGTFVGTCAFKSPPQNAEVEIAYFTFPQHEGQGVATQMARWLTELAEKNGVKRVKAQTLPEKNASTRILEKLGFTFVGPTVHPDDGTIWEWQR